MTALLSTFLCFALLCMSLHGSTFVYVGCNSTAPQGMGIYLLDEDNGALTSPRILQADYTLFVAVHPNGKNVYVLSGNYYVAYNVDSAGNFTEINRILGGPDPAHLSISFGGNYLFGANYDDGSFEVFPIGKDGSLSKHTQRITPGTGSQVNPDRQDGPHAHMITTSPDGSKVVAVDLGADKIFVFDFDQTTGLLTPATVPYGQVPSGAGCKHIAFHHEYKYAYVINELGSSVDAYIFDSVRGSLQWIQSQPALPDNYTGVLPSYPAEIRIHPNGRFLYGSNRGANSVVVFQIDTKSGKITPVQWISSHGAWPRGLNISPSGRWLYAANQNSDNVAWFKLDPNTGLLTYVADVKISAPLDVEFSV